MAALSSQGSWRYRLADRRLGRYFPVVVKTTEDQPIVEHGLYRVLRHPSYTGLLLAIPGSRHGALDS